MAGVAKRAWRRVRGRLRRSRLLRGALAGFVTSYVRLVHRTNPLVRGSVKPDEVLTGEPVIVALWHGRHFMVPLVSPPGVPVTALISRSGDAELNAAVLARLGVETVRGSGGGTRERGARKGGVGGFKALADALAAGRTVVTIADPLGRPREAGEGIIRLARATGVPIVPVAYSSSRAKVFERAWDRAAMNLPFGRAAVIAGPRLHVPTEADDAQVVEARELLTRALEEATRRAGALCGAEHDTAGSFGGQPAVSASDGGGAPAPQRDGRIERHALDHVRSRGEQRERVA